MSSINNLTSSYLQSILSSTLQNAGVTQNSSNTSGINAPSVTLQSDNSNLSPFAQLMSTLQQLEQSDPSKYQQVTQQIASNLQSAAQTAQSQGNTTAANQLNQLSQDFTNASQSGQLPNISDLAKAAGGHHHFHGGSASSSSDSSTDSSSSSTSTSSASSTTGDSQLVSQLFAGQSNTTQSNALNPMSIIWNTLSQAGITTSHS